MKIRTGFVSNSSSSSFVLIVKKELHDKVFETLNKYEKYVIEAVSHEATVFGLPAIEIGDMTDMNGYSYTFEDLDLDYDEDEEERSPYEAFGSYQSKVMELGNKEDYYRWGIG